MSLSDCDPPSRVPLSRVDRPLSESLPPSSAGMSPVGSTPVNALHADASGTATNPKTRRNERISARIYDVPPKNLPAPGRLSERP
jgi:hypothetical protein